MGDVSYYEINSLRQLRYDDKIPIGKCAFFEIDFWSTSASERGRAMPEDKEFKIEEG